MTARLSSIVRAGLADLEQLADAIWLTQHLPPGALSRSPAPLVAGAPSEPALSQNRQEESRTSKGDRAGGEGQEQTGHDMIPVTSGSAARTGRRLRSPGAPPLTGRIALGRALRAIGWEVNMEERWRVVEDRTAKRIALTQLWIPVLEPEREPALDLVFVLDSDPRLRPWLELMRAFVAVARSSGRVRNVTIWTIAGDEPRPRLRAGGKGAARDPRHILDSTGRSVVLVISDFAGPLWRDKSGLACLRLWGRRMSTTLISLLPERLWERTILGGLPAGRVFARRPCQASAALCTEAAPDSEGVSLPVIAIDPTSVRAWAALVSGDIHTRLTSVAVLPDVSPATRARTLARAVVRQQALDDDPAELERQTQRIHQRLIAASRASDVDDPIDRLQHTTSPSVVRLAAALVRAPLRLDVMRLVQRAIAPSTGPLELADVLGSGLFTPRPASGLHESSVWFDIAPDARARVAELAPRRDGVRVLELVGRYIRDHLRGGYDFEALVVDPGSEPAPVPEELRPFARLYVEELERLGGRYGELAQRLARAAAVSDDARQPAAGAPQLDPAQRGRSVRHASVTEAADVIVPRVIEARSIDLGLVVGIDHYPRFRSLRGAVAEATSFHKWLRDPDGGNVANEHAMLLVSNSEPISPLQDNVDEALWQLMRRADEIGGVRRLYFYFSGNAATSDMLVDDVALLLPKWSQSLSRMALSLQEYIGMLSSAGLFEEVVCFLDVAMSSPQYVVGLPPTLTHRATPQARSLGPARVFIAYTSAPLGIPQFEIADSGAWEGVFTRTLLRILRSHDGITANALKRALEIEVSHRGVRVIVRNELLENAQFGIRGKNPELRVVFRRARGRVTLRDGDLQIIATADANSSPWVLLLASGLYQLEDDSGVTLAVQVLSGVNEITF